MLRAFLASLLLAACTPQLSQEAHSNPPKIYFQTNTDRYVAELNQKGKHATYEVYSIADTHSMEPFLDKTMDVLVDTSVKFEDLKVDDIIVYDAVWQPAGAPLVCHRVNALDHNTLIVSGDNVAEYERGIYGVTKENYRGKVVLVMVLNK